MARPLRLEYPGAVYHVTSRGNAREVFFLSEADRQRFLAVLGDTVEKYHWLCHAYCLMDNHYHLVVETPDGNLSVGMRQLNGVYTQAFNRAHQRVGHVFQGRYKAIWVEKDSHLLELCRYVVLNPVRAGMVAKPDQWQWSSYRSTAYAGRGPDYLRVDWLLGQFSPEEAAARSRYRKFVAEGIVGQGEPWKELVGQVFLGSESFVAHLEEVLGSKRRIREIPRAQRYPGRPPLHLLFGDNRVGNRQVRNNRIKEAYIVHGYTLKEIADHLRIHYTTASKAVTGKRNKRNK